MWMLAQTDENYIYDCHLNMTYYILFANFLRYIKILYEMCHK